LEEKKECILAKGIGGHIAAEKMFEATGQQEFDVPAAVEVRNFHSLVTWLGQSPFNSAQSIR
jgi:hypothetical protein